MAQEIVQWKTQEIGDVVSRLRYSQPRLNASGKGKSVSVAYHTEAAANARPVFQTPKMYAPFGVSSFTPEDGGYVKFTLPLSFKTDATRPFLDLLRAVDEYNIQAAFENQEAWFGDKGKAREIIEDRYTRLVQHKDERYEPRFTGKLDFRNNEYQGLVFDDSTPPKRMTLDYLEKACTVIALVEFGPMWIVDKRFGQTVRVIQAKVFKMRSLTENAIVDDDGDDGAPGAAPAVMVNDSEDFDAM